VAEFLDEIVETHGKPERIYLDNGPEFISKALDLWAYQAGVTLDFSRPGKPTDNACIESFNGSFRGECLNMNWFLSTEDARTKIEAWRREYNEFRPHSSLGEKTPEQFLWSGSPEFRLRPETNVSSGPTSPGRSSSEIPNSTAGVGISGLPPQQVRFRSQMPMNTQLS